MSHAYTVGQDVYYDPQFRNTAAPGLYKIVRTLPVESEDRLTYRIKSAVEKFERTVNESDLTLADSPASELLHHATARELKHQRAPVTGRDRGPRCGSGPKRGKPKRAETRHRNQRGLSSS